MTYRKTPQPLLPKRKPTLPDDVPNIFPTYPITSGNLQEGYVALAQRLMSQSLVLIDGYIGILWTEL